MVAMRAVVMGGLKVDSKADMKAGSMAEMMVATMAR